MTELKEKAIVSDWPSGIHAGKTVRFFEVVGPFVVTQWGQQWRVRDTRKANRRGGPDDGIWFNNVEDVINHVNVVH